MQEQEIINIALDNLQKNTNIKGKWVEFAIKELDGKLNLMINNEEIKFNVEIKKELRNHLLPQIAGMAEKYPPLILVAEIIFPKIKGELRERNIAYLEANGNIYIKHNGTYLWIDANKPIKSQKEHGNRAFTKTGLKIVYEFLIDETWINKPYREIAEKTGTGIGNITNIIKGLKKDGFLLKLTRDKNKLTSKKDLLQKWIGAYGTRLKPHLLIGQFRFVRENDFINWKNLHLQTGKTWWGGEAAGDLLTNYLRPGELTLYTTENRNELIKKYRLVADIKGNIKIYKVFWHQKDETTNNTVHPLLVYADLINTGDRRCIETAQKIYDELLANKL